MSKAAVLGTGSWGTTFGKVLADAAVPTVLWARRAEVARDVTERHRNSAYLPGVALPETLTATTDARAALDGADLVVLAVPSQTLRDNLGAVVGHIAADALLVSLMKGVELGTTKRMSEVIADVTGAEPSRVAVVSGPNLAHEIAAEQPTATVVACADHGRACWLQTATTTRYFRPYTNTDVVGAEIGGAVKNVVALAAGIARGMGFGDNTLASIVTRGLAETARLGVALGADESTFAGLAGLGDLVATCSSPLSRNRTFGERLGGGQTVAEVVAVTSQTAEGVKSCRAILDLAVAHGVDMPITQAVVHVVDDGMTPGDMLRSLMSREVKPE
ncbi:MAG: NAD(P)H-dependent glycerol-3-phosphate dehydrogenase [Mycobacteriales bacterium]